MRNQSISSLLVILFFGMYLNVFILGVYSQCLDDQRTLLLQLMNNSDAHYQPLWNQSSDCCTWIGVSCDVEGRVTGLDLNDNLFGEFYDATSLFKLENLKSLSLAQQDLTSMIPFRLSKLKKLTFLNLSKAGFEVQTVTEISQLTRLVTLDISSSCLIGDDGELENLNLQKLVQNYSFIRQLYLDGVSISANGHEWGNVLSALPALQELSMEGCNLSGPIDSSLARLRNLRVVHLSGNNLSSPVPEFFATFTNLNSLHLSDCGLSGVFPQSIFQVLTLTSIDISYNFGLHGSFPDFPMNGSVQILVVSNTAFSGVLPNSMNNLNQLSVLDLSDCQFHGTLPNSISKLTQLTDLKLENNNFTGPFPSSLFILPMLKNVHLSNNHFSRLDDFSHVSNSTINFLDLSCNDLEGPIPSSLFQFTQLSILNLSFNKLSGDLEFNKISMLRKLEILDLSYNNLSIIDAKSPFPSFPTIGYLGLASCNLTTFPQFLKSQDQTTHLYYLDLSKNHIFETIPSWIWNLTVLNVLNLSQNYLRDWEEPQQSISQSLAYMDLHSNHLQRPLSFLPESLDYLDYSSNNISTPIPSNIGNYDLLFLSFSSNKIHGNIPESICNLKILELLDLSNNSLSGSIPKCLFAMNGNLEVLNLSRNKLIGSLDTIPGSCDLRTLQLNGNLLQGNLPKYLATCDSLEVLDIGHNQIDDKFPCWLESIPTLRVLILRSNKFHGPIECRGTKANWSELQIIDLASNGFGGKIPSEFFKTWKLMMADENDEKLRKVNQLQLDHEVSTGPISYKVTLIITSKGLEYELENILTIYMSVDLSCNKFSGPIPDEIGKLKALYILNLSHNALWGYIPTSLGNLKNLESLDLSNNSLSGEIPMQLAGLSFLSFLNLSFNHLVGRIPTGTQLQSFEAASYKSNKGLCGPPLTQNCSDRLPPPSRISLSDTSSVDWKLISVELGFTFGIGMFILPILLWKQWRLMYSEFADKILYHMFPQLDYVQEIHGEQCYRILRWRPY